jgi:hypothetical protein
MERYCSTGQSFQRAVAPTEEEEEEDDDDFEPLFTVLPTQLESSDYPTQLIVQV